MRGKIILLAVAVSALSTSAAAGTDSAGRYVIFKSESKHQFLGNTYGNNYLAHIWLGDRRTGEAWSCSGKIFLGPHDPVPPVNPPKGNFRCGLILKTVTGPDLPTDKQAIFTFVDTRLPRSPDTNQENYMNDGWGVVFPTTKANEVHIRFCFSMIQNWCLGNTVTLPRT